MTKKQSRKRRQEVDVIVGEFTTKMQELGIFDLVLYFEDKGYTQTTSASGDPFLDIRAGMELVWSGGRFLATSTKDVPRVDVSGICLTRKKKSAK